MNVSALQAERFQQRPTPSGQFDPPQPAGLRPTVPTGAELVDAHSRGRNVDAAAVARELKGSIQQHPQEATRLALQVYERLPVDDRDEVAQAFVQAHSDAELRALAQTDAGKGALVLAVNELGRGSVHGDEARDAQRIGAALGVDVKVEANTGWAAISSTIHTVLDLAGFIPGLGAIPDLINAGLYAAEGDYANAALSATAAIPIAGDGIKGTAMVIKHADEALAAGTQLARHGDEAAALGSQAVRHGDEVAAAVPAAPGRTGEPSGAGGPGSPGSPRGPASPSGPGGGPGMPGGLSYRIDLPQHLAGPHGFKGQALHGTHNLDNALAELGGRGIPHRLEPTGTPGISELRYDVPKADGTLKSYSKTVYDPDIFSDAKMLDLAQAAGERGFAAFQKNPIGSSSFDFVEGGVNMRVYINKTAEGTPFVGNVHPIK